MAASAFRMSVAARLTQRHLTKLFALDEDIETVDDPTLQYFRPDVVAGDRIRRIDARTLHAGQQALHAGVVAAHDVQPVERDLVHKTDERLVDGFLIAVVIQMVAVHVGHDVDDRQQAEGTSRRIRRASAIRYSPCPSRALAP